MDKTNIMSRSEALVSVESILAELRDADTPANLPEFTQNIMVQACKPGEKHPWPGATYFASTPL